MSWHDQQFNFCFLKEYSHAPKSFQVGYLTLATSPCSLSHISDACLTWEAMWTDFAEIDHWILYAMVFEKKSNPG